jgi:hypothetical protein
MYRYNRTPLTVEAFEWKGYEGRQWPEWFEKFVDKPNPLFERNISLGDYVVKDVDNSIRIYKPERFNQLFEKTPPTDLYYTHK